MAETNYYDLYKGLTTKEQQLYRSLTDAAQSGDWQTMDTIKDENPDIYSSWNDFNNATNGKFFETYDPSIQAGNAAESKEAQLYDTLREAWQNRDTNTINTIQAENPEYVANWLQEEIFSGNHLYGDEAADANATANGAGTKYTTDDWENFDVNGDGVLSSEENAAYNKYRAANGEDYSGFVSSGDGTNSSWTQYVQDLLDKTGTTRAVEDAGKLNAGIESTLKTGDISDTTDQLAESMGDAATLNMADNSDTVSKVSNGLKDATKTAIGGTVSATQAASDATNAVNALYQGDTGKAAEYLQKMGINVDEAILGSGTLDLNYLADIINENNTGDSNGVGSVGFTQNVNNMIGAMLSGDSGYDAWNTDNVSKYAGMTADAAAEAAKAAGEAAKNASDNLHNWMSNLGGSGDGGGDTESDFFSNWNKVNKILTEGTSQAMDTYNQQTATALQPLTEAKDTYNYTDQLDNYNQDWQNYKEQTASNNAYLDTQKDAAQNWETYMNPLTDYLNEQLAKNTRAGYGSMMSSSSAQNAVNKAIADNTASQYQNAVNTAISNSQNNQNIANSQQNNANSYLTGSQQTLTNNVTPTTDWTAYMTDYADTSLNAQNNLVNAQAQAASSQPTEAETWTDLIKAGIAGFGALASAL